MLEIVPVKVSSGSEAPAKNGKLGLVRDANEAVWANLNLESSECFCVKVSVYSGATGAGSFS